jgi:hypothetical protein
MKRLLVRSEARILRVIGKGHDIVVVRLRF